MKLEAIEYRRMFIRDVNNYIAEGRDGGLKRKGAFEYERGWHQNQSALVVPRAVEAHLVEGKNIDKFIREHSNPFDFMLRTKARYYAKTIESKHILTLDVRSTLVVK